MGSSINSFSTILSISNYDIIREQQKQSKGKGEKDKKLFSRKDAKGTKKRKKLDTDFHRRNAEVKGERKKEEKTLDTDIHR